MFAEDHDRRIGAILLDIWLDLGTRLPRSILPNGMSCAAP